MNQVVVNRALLASVSSAIIAFALVAGAGAASPLSASRSIVLDPPLAPLTDAELATKLDSEILGSQLGQFWGTVLVAKDGKVLLSKGYGLANDKLDPMTADTIVDIGSIAKQFTAAAILRLEMDGKLSTTDPVSKFFPDDFPARGKTITLAHLLNHTSGLSDTKGAIQALTFPDRDGAVLLALQSEPTGEPGEKFEYCNGAYVVLAAVIEKASGASFEDYLRDMLFKPAGMTSTGFLDGKGLDVSRGAARVVSNRSGKPRRLTILQDGWGWGFKGAGGVLTTMGDMLKWDQALRLDSILNAQAKAKLYNPVLDGYSMGWFVQDTGAGIRVHHSGSTRGFIAQYSRDLDKNLVVLVVSNDRNNPVAMADRLRQIVLPGESAGGAATLKLDGYALNDNKGIEIPSRMLWRVAKDGARVSLCLDDPERKTSPVTSALSREHAMLIAKELRIAIKYGAPHRKEAVAEGMDVGLYVAPYQAQPDGGITLPAEAKWMPYPWYNGPKDPRPTLVMIDEENGFWPIIAKMHPDVATKLVDDLDAILK